MNKLRKVGLSALAGSLAAMSANAATLTVSGEANLSYVNMDSTVLSDKVRGNQLGMQNDLAFTGSGEVNGTTVSYYNNLNDSGTVTSSSLTFDMGDNGKFMFDVGTGGNGVGSLRDTLPRAFVQSWDQSGTKQALAGDGAMNTLVYIGNFAGMGVNVNIDPRTGDSGSYVKWNSDSSTSGAVSTGSAYSAAVTLPEMIPGLALAVGYGDATIKNGLTTANNQETIAASVKYTMGRATVGYNATQTSKGAVNTAANYTKGLGLAVNLNENLALSINRYDNEFAKASAVHVTEENTGIGAAYTMGGMTLALQHNDTENFAGTATSDRDTTEISLTFAF